MFSAKSQSPRPKNCSRCAAVDARGRQCSRWYLTTKSFFARPSTGIGTAGETDVVLITSAPE